MKQLTNVAAIFALVSCSQPDRNHGSVNSIDKDLSEDPISPGDAEEPVDDGVELIFSLPPGATLKTAGITHYSVESTPKDCAEKDKAIVTSPVAAKGKGFLYPDCNQNVVVNLGVGAATSNEGEKSPSQVAKFKFTYVDNVKAYVDKSCLGANCHAGKRSPRLTTFAEVKAAGILSNSSIQTGRMPKGAAVSTAEQKAMFQQWLNDGFPEKQSLVKSVPDEGATPDSPGTDILVPQDAALKIIYFSVSFPVSKSQAVESGYETIPLTFIKTEAAPATLPATMVAAP